MADSHPYPALIDARFELRQKLGEGGMGVVFACYDRQAARLCAIKFLTLQQLLTPAGTRHFVHEAQLMLRLAHPAIVQVIAAGSADGQPYTVMELCAGANGVARSLQELQDDLPDHRVPAAQLLGWLPTMLASVAYLHGLGVVHRDLKPANYLLHEQDGRWLPKLTDFGLAAVTADADLAAHFALGVSLSMQQVGQAQKAWVGTYKYMSPELRNCQPVDARSDVYSLGLITYFLATGYERLNPELPSQAAPGYTPAFDAWLERALAEDPRERFADAAALLAAAPFPTAALPPAASALDADDWLRQALAEEAPDPPTAPPPVPVRPARPTATPVPWPTTVPRSPPSAAAPAVPAPAVPAAPAAPAPVPPIMPPTPAPVPPAALPTASSPARPAPAPQQHLARRMLARVLGVAALVTCVAAVMYAVIRLNRNLRDYEPSRPALLPAVVSEVPTTAPAAAPAAAPPLPGGDPEEWVAAPGSELPSPAPSVAAGPGPAEALSPAQPLEPAPAPPAILTAPVSTPATVPATASTAPDFDTADRARRAYEMAIAQATKAVGEGRLSQAEALLWPTAVANRGDEWAELIRRCHPELLQAKVPGPIHWLGFSPNRRILCVDGLLLEARTLQPLSQQQQLALPAGATVLRGAWTTDSQRLLLWFADDLRGPGGNNPTVAQGALFAVATGKILTRFFVPRREQVTSVAIEPNDTYAAIGCANSDCFVYKLSDTAATEVSHFMNLNNPNLPPIVSTAFLADGQRLWFAGARVELWRYREMRADFHAFRGGLQWVSPRDRRLLAVAPWSSGQFPLIVTLAEDQVEVLDAASGGVLARGDFPTPAAAAIFAPVAAEARPYANDSLAQVALLDRRTGHPRLLQLSYLALNPASIMPSRPLAMVWSDPVPRATGATHLAFCPGGGRLLTGSAAGLLNVWDLSGTYQPAAPALTATPESFHDAQLQQYLEWLDKPHPNR